MLHLWPNFGWPKHVEDRAKCKPVFTTDNTRLQQTTTGDKAISTCLSCKGRWHTHTHTKKKTKQTNKKDTHTHPPKQRNSCWNSYHNNSPKNTKKSYVGPSSNHPLSLSCVRSSMSEKTKTDAGNPTFLSTRQKITPKVSWPILHPPRVWARCDLPLPKKQRNLCTELLS